MIIELPEQIQPRKFSARSFSPKTASSTQTGEGGASFPQCMLTTSPESSVHCTCLGSALTGTSLMSSVSRGTCAARIIITYLIECLFSLYNCFLLVLKVLRTCVQFDFEILFALYNE